MYTFTSMIAYFGFKEMPKNILYLEANRLYFNEKFI